jgi:phospholipase/carboxylesterase
MLRTELIPAIQQSEPRLLIALHGLGDSMEGYRWLPEAMGLPWLSYLLVNAPEPYYGGFAWYDLYGNPSPGIQRSRQSLFDLLDEMRAGKFAAEKIVVFGFSQGCLMAVEIGARYPHRLAGIVGVSGYVHEAMRLVPELSPQARQQRFLITHGTEDPLLPIERTRRQVELLQRAGLKIDWREFAKPHIIDVQAELPVLRDFVRNSYV